MNIDERCYGHEPANSQLGKLRGSNAKLHKKWLQAFRENQELKLENEQLKQKIKTQTITHPTWLNTGCPDHDIPRCQCCCDDWYTSQLETIVENA